MSAEDAVLLRAVGSFGQARRDASTGTAIDLSREQYAEDRSGEINPAARPDAAGSAKATVRVGLMLMLESGASKGM